MENSRRVQTLSSSVVRAIRIAHLAAIVTVALVLIWALSRPSGQPEVLLYSRRDLTYHGIVGALLLILLTAYRLRLHRALAKRARLICMCLLFHAIVLILFEATIRILDPLGISDLNNQRIIKQRVVRLDTPPVGKGLHPNVNIRLRGWSVITNSYGFRDDAFPEQKPPNERRLLMLGDSFLFGHGVDQDKIATAVLERQLLVASGHLWQVINTGVGSYATHEQRLIVNTAAERFDVDAVLLLYCLNDCQARFIRFSNVHEIPDYVPAGTRSSPSAYAVLAQRLWRPPLSLYPRILDYVHWFIKARRQAAPPQPLNESDWAWRFSRENLELIKRRCDALDIPLVIAYLNHYESSAPGSFSMSVSSALEDFCRCHAIPYYDLREPSLRRGLQNHRNSYIDGHPNADGQVILADILFDILVQEHVGALGTAP